MSEFRQNVTTGEWVIIAPGRKHRPDDFRHSKPSIPDGHDITHHDDCPFCKGNESMCNEPLYEIFEGADWKLRIVPNIFAAVSGSADPTRVREGIHLKAGGYGTADVLIESPVHNSDIPNYPLAQVVELIKAYRYRFNEITRDTAINMVNIFRNHGPSAGASLRHPHSQIIGSMVAPPHVTDQIEFAKRHYNTWGTCVYCTMIAEEIASQVRVVQESDYFLALCPFASKAAYEVRIFPKRHSSLFGEINAEEEIDLAVLLKSTLQRLALVLEDPDYNYYIRSVTIGDGQVQFYHWYLSIMPRTSHQAGFELGTGIFINTTAPESCAEELRKAKIPAIPPRIIRSVLAQ